MRLVAVLASVAALGMAPAVLAQAKAYQSKSAISGKPVPLGSYVSFKSNCTPGPPLEIRVVESPKNGILVVSPAKLKANSPKCPNAEAAGHVIVYQATASFVGVDSVTYEVRTPTGQSQSFTVSINVAADQKPAPKEDKGKSI
jgi:hypothetical protein